MLISIELGAQTGGILLCCFTTLVTLFSSVIEECLKEFHRTAFFEDIDEGEHNRFDELLKRDWDFFFITRFLRPIAYISFFLGMLFFLSENFASFEWPDVGLSAIFTLVMALIFAGIIPSLWANFWAEKTLRMWLPAYAFLTIPFHPILWINNVLLHGVAKARGEDPEDDPEQDFEDEIADQLDEAQREGVIGEGEKQMIASIIDFGDSTVRDVMTPRIDMVCIDVAKSLDEALKLSNDAGHSRIPVFEGNRDNIVGIFYVRDAMKLWKIRSDDELSINKVMREPRFVPDTQDLLALLAEFRATKVHLAIVTDEFGGTSGLVTLEDLLEEIVGDIQDEFDLDDAPYAPSQRLHFSGKGLATVDARIRVDEVNRAFDADLPRSNLYSSLGGLLATHVGHVPIPGEEVTIDCLRMKVIDATERMATRVHIEKFDKDDSSRSPSGRHIALPDEKL